MFEKLVSSLLSKYLGDFVENIDVENLKISVRQGKVQLHKLVIRTQALDFLQLPVEVKQGYIGSISIDVQWTALTSKPVAVTIEDVYVVAGPKDPAAANRLSPEQRAQQLRQAKRENLDAWESIRFPEPDQKDKAANGASVATKIIDNIQVTVRRLHIRYESDPRSAHPFTAGLALEELSTVSTGPDWRKLERFAENAEAVYRSMALRNLSLYLNAGDRTGVPRHDLALLVDVFAKPRPAAQWSWLLPPIVGRLHLITFKPTPDVLAARADAPPRLSLQVELETLGLSLQRAQYLGVLTLMAELFGSSASRKGLGGASTHQTQQEASLYRSPAPADRDSYIALYKRRLGGYRPLSEEEKRTLLSLEDEFSFSDVVQLRRWAIEIAERELQVESKAVDIQRAEQSGGWFSFFRRGPKEAPHRQLPSEELERIFSNQYVEDERQMRERDLARLPRAYITSRFVFAIEKAFLILAKADSSPMLELQTRSLRLDVLQRPKNMGVALSVMAFEVREHVTDKTLFPYLVTFPQGNSPSAARDESGMLVEARRKAEPLLRLEYERNPVDESLEADSSLIIYMRSLEVVYSALVLRHIIEFFAPPASRKVTRLRRRAGKRLEALRAATQAQLLDALEHQRRMFLRIDAAAPTIVVAENTVDAWANLLVVDLGHFTMQSKLQALSERQAHLEALRGASSIAEVVVGAAAPGSGRADAFYETYELRGKEMAAFLTTGGGDWRRHEADKAAAERDALAVERRSHHPPRNAREARDVVVVPRHRPLFDEVDLRSARRGRLYLVRPVEMTVLLQRPISTDVKTLPSLKISLQVDRVDAELSVRSFRRVVHLSRFLSPYCASVNAAVPAPAPSIGELDGGGAKFGADANGLEGGKNEGEDEDVEGGDDDDGGDKDDGNDGGAATDRRTEETDEKRAPAGTFVASAAASAAVGAAASPARGAPDGADASAGGSSAPYLLLMAELGEFSAVVANDVAGRPRSSFGVVEAHLTSLSTTLSLALGELSVVSSVGGIQILDLLDGTMSSRSARQHATKRLLLSSVEAEESSVASGTAATAGARRKTRGRKYMLMVQYKWLQPSSPRYHQIDQEIVLHASSLVLSLHREALPGLVTFFVRDLWGRGSQGLDPPPPTHLNAAAPRAPRAPRSAKGLHVDGQRIAESAHDDAPRGSSSVGSAASRVEQVPVLCPLSGQPIDVPMEAANFGVVVSQRGLEDLVRRGGGGADVRVDGSKVVPVAAFVPRKQALRITVFCRELRLQLFAASLPVCDATASSFSFVYSWSPPLQHLHATLQSVTIQDMTPQGSAHRLVMETVLEEKASSHEHLVDFAYTFHSDARTPPTDFAAAKAFWAESYPDPLVTQPLAAMRLRLEQVRVAVLVRFVRELLAFPSDLLESLRALQQSDEGDGEGDGEGGAKGEDASDAALLMFGRSIEERDEKSELVDDEKAMNPSSAASNPSAPFSFDDEAAKPISGHVSVSAPKHVAEEKLSVAEREIAHRMSQQRARELQLLGAMSGERPFAFTAMDLKLRRVEIVLPVSSSSMECVVARVDSLSLSTSLAGTDGRAFEVPAPARRGPATGTSVAAAPTAANPARSGALGAPVVWREASWAQAVGSVPSYSYRESTTSLQSETVTEPEFFDARELKDLCFVQYVLELGSFSVDTRAAPADVGHANAALVSLALVSVPRVAVVASWKVPPPPLLLQGDDDLWGPHRERYHDLVVDSVLPGLNVLFSRPQAALIGAVLQGNLAEPNALVKTREQRHAERRGATGASAAASGVLTPRTPWTPRTPRTPRRGALSPRGRSDSVASGVSVAVDVPTRGGARKAEAVSSQQPVRGSSGRQEDVAASVEVIKKTAPSTLVRVALQQAAVQVLAEPDADKSQSLVLQWSSGVRYETKGDGRWALSADIAGMRAVQWELAEKHSLVVIREQIDRLLALSPDALLLAPLSVRLAVERTFSLLGALHANQAPSVPPEFALRGNVRLSDVELNLTFQSYRLLSRVLGALWQSPPPPQEAQVAGASRVTRSSSQRASNEKRGSNVAPKPGGLSTAVSTRRASLVESFREDDGEDKDAQPPLAHREQALESNALSSFGEIDLRTSISSFTVLLVNDVAGFRVPLARAGVDEMQVHVSGFAQKRSLNAAVSMRAEYYNPKVAAWEPLLEPWAAALRVAQSIQGRRADGSDLVVTQMSVSAEDEVNLTLSRAMIDSLDSSSKLLRAVEAASSAKEHGAASNASAAHSSSRQSFSPFRIRNATDLELVYRCGSVAHSQANAAELLDALRLAPLEEQALDFGGTGAEQRRHSVASPADPTQSAAASFRHFISLQLAGFRPAHNVQVDRSGVTAMELTAIQDGGNRASTAVVVEVSVERGMKIVSVHSLVCVVNHCAVPLEIPDGVIAPSERRWLSLAQAGQRSLRLRPARAVAVSGAQPASTTDQVRDDDAVGFAWSDLVALDAASTGGEERRRSGWGRLMVCPIEPAHPSAPIAASAVSAPAPASDDSKAPLLRHDDAERKEAAHENEDDPEVDAFHALVQVERRVLGEDRASATLFVVHIRPPMVLENLLASLICVRISQRGEKEQDRPRGFSLSALASAKSVPARFVTRYACRVGRGRELALHYIDPLRPVFLSLSVPAMRSGWSERVELGRRSNAAGALANRLSKKLVQEVPVQDHWDRALTVMIESLFQTPAWDADRANSSLEAPSVDETMMDQGNGASASGDSGTAAQAAKADVQAQSQESTFDNLFGEEGVLREGDAWLLRQRRAALYVPYWVFDLTEWQLVVSDGETLPAGTPIRRHWKSQLALPPPTSSQAPDETALRHEDSEEDNDADTDDEDAVAGAATELALRQRGLRKAVMFSFRSGGLAPFGRKGVLVATHPAVSQRSDSLSLEQVGSSGAAALATGERRLLEVGVQIQAGWGQFRRTRLVTLAPRFIVVNNLPLPIQLRQHRTEAEDYVSLPAGGLEAWSWPDRSKDKLVSFRVLPDPQQLRVREEKARQQLERAEERRRQRLAELKYVAADELQPDYDYSDDSEDWDDEDEWAEREAAVAAAEEGALLLSGLGSDWSGCFSVHEVMDLAMTVRSGVANDSFLARVEVRAKDAAVYIVLSVDNPAAPPYRLENRCACDKLRFSQTHVHRWETLLPFTVVNYAWDEPLAQRTVSLAVFGDAEEERTYGLDSPGDLDVVHLRNPERTLYVYVTVDGPTKVLTVSDFPSRTQEQAIRAKAQSSRGGAEEFKGRRASDARASASAATSAAVVAAEAHGNERLSKGAILLSRYVQIRDSAGKLREDLERAEARLEALRDRDKQRAAELELNPAQVDVEAGLSAAERRQSMLARELSTPDGCLLVQVVEARGLAGVNWDGTSDPYVCVTFGEQQQQTPVLKKNLNPWWNHSMIFRASSMLSNPPPVKVAVMNRNMLLADDYLGGIKAIDVSRLVDPALLRWRLKNPKHRGSPHTFSLHQWFKLEPVRHLDKLTGDILIRIQWMESESRLVADEVRRMEEELAGKERVLGIIRTHHQAEIQSYEESEAARAQANSKASRSGYAYYARVCDYSRRESNQAVLLGSSGASNAAHHKHAHRRAALERRIPLHHQDSAGMKDAVGIAHDEEARLVVSLLSAELVLQQGALARLVRRGLASAAAEATRPDVEQSTSADESVLSAGGALLFTLSCMGHHSAHRLVMQRDANVFRAGPLSAGEVLTAQEYYADCEALGSRNGVPLHVRLVLLHPPPQAPAAAPAPDALRGREPAPAEGEPPLLQPAPIAVTLLAESVVTLRLDNLQVLDENGEPLEGAGDAAAAEADATKRPRGEAARIDTAGAAARHGDVPFHKGRALHLARAVPGLDARIVLAVSRFEAAPAHERLQSMLVASVPLIGVSIVDAVPRELLYFVAQGLRASVEGTERQRTVALVLHRIQLDNQLYSAKFPVVLAPQPSATGESAALLTVEITQRLTHAEYPVAVYSLASVMMRKLELQVEEALVWNVLAFLNEVASDRLGWRASSASSGKDRDELSEHELSLTTRPLALVFSSPPPSATKMFFRHLQLNVEGADLSFEADPALRARFDGLSYNPMSVLLSVAGAAFGSISKSPLRLNALIIENALGNVETLVVPIAQHYKRQALSQVYKLLGSFELIGNPVQLVSSIGSGFRDFVYMPAEGLSHGKSARAVGLGFVKGTSSLVKHTATGVLGAAANISGAAGKGLSVLLDEDYKAERLRSQQAGAPKHALAGLGQGLKSLGSGVFAGVSGIIVDPFRGARSGGVKGFFKGIGRGLVGVVAKPAVGVVDLTSSVLQGIRNTADLFSDVATNRRVRAPRFVHADGLRAYDPVAAEFQLFLAVERPLQGTRERRREHERYVFHQQFGGGSWECLLLASTHRLALRVKPRDSSPQDAPGRSSEPLEDEKMPLEFLVLLRDIRSIETRGSLLRLSIVGERDSDQHWVPCLSAEAAETLRRRVDALRLGQLSVVAAVLVCGRQWLDVTARLAELLQDGVEVRGRGSIGTRMLPLHELFGAPQFATESCSLVVEFQHGPAVQSRVFADGEPIALL